MAAVSLSGPSAVVSTSAPPDFTEKFKAFRAAYLPRNRMADYATMKELIRDREFLNWLTVEKSQILVDIFEDAVLSASGQWDFVQTVFNQCSDQFKKFRPSEFNFVTSYLSDPQVFRTMDKDALSTLVGSMARLQHWPGVEQIFNERFNDLSVKCLLEIVEKCPPEHPQFVNIAEKIRPKLNDKSEVAARCLFAIASKLLRTDKPENKSTGEEILKTWHQKFPYSPIPRTRKDAELIITHAPEQLMGCLMHLARSGGAIDARGLICQSSITAEGLGNILLIATSECAKRLTYVKEYLDHQAFIEEILDHSQAVHISRDVLRHAWISFVSWGKEIDGVRLVAIRGIDLQEVVFPMAVVQSHEALCKRLGKLIFS